MCVVRVYIQVCIYILYIIYIHVRFVWLLWYAFVRDNAERVGRRSPSGHEPRVKGSVCTHAWEAASRAERAVCGEESTSDTTGGLQERWAAGVPE